MDEADTLISDPPYSEKTVVGHDAADLMVRDGVQRRKMGYGYWTPDDVREFCSYWSPRIRGWFVAFCDDMLLPVYRDTLQDLGRCTFSNLPYVERGMTVRRQGDGHSSWTTFVVAARPRTREFAKWGTLQGAYILPPGRKEKRLVTGQKTLWVMEEVIRDHSRVGDLIVDPCCGAGSTIVAAVRLSRNAIGSDMSESCIAIATERVFGKRNAASQLAGRVELR